MESGGHHPVLECEARLDQSGHAGGGVQVSHIALDGAQQARAGGVGLIAENLGQGGYLDGIAHGRAGAVGLDVADAVGGRIGQGKRLGDHLGLPFHARRCESHLAGAVVVYRGAQDDRIHEIAIHPGFLEATQHHQRHPVAGDGSTGIRVEGTTVAVTRHDAPRLEEISALQRDVDRDATGDRHVALARQQALASEVNGDEGG